MLSYCRQVNNISLSLNMQNSNEYQKVEEEQLSQELRQFQYPANRELTTDSKQNVCSICLQSKMMYSTTSVFTCKHFDICLDCIIEYCKNCLSQNSVPTCMKQNCSGSFMFDNNQVLNILPVGLKNQLIDSYRNQRLKSYKRCTMPDCSGFVKNGTCNICLTIFCQCCFEKQHRGQCGGNVYLPEGIKRCPHCGEGIQQDGGCLHMKCQKCKYQFCFRCLQPWSPKHHSCGGVKTLGEAVFGWFNQKFCKK